MQSVVLAHRNMLKLANGWTLALTIRNSMRPLRRLSSRLKERSLLLTEQVIVQEKSGKFLRKIETGYSV